MLQSIIVYTFLIGFMIFCALLASQNGSYFSTSSGIIRKRSFWRFEIIAPLLFFSLIFGMRFDVGADHIGYLYGYLEKRYVGKGEPLFSLLSDIGWGINLHYVLYFAIIAFIQVFFFFYAFKDERYLFPFIVFFLFTNGDWLFWMNGIRQALAMCIWLFSIKYIYEKNILKYIIWCTVAILFHRSAIMLIIFYPFLRIGRDYFKSIPFQLILFALAFVFNKKFSVVIINFEPLINSYLSILGSDTYGSYDLEGLMSRFKETNGTRIAYYFKILLNATIILYSGALKKYYNNRLFNIYYFFFFIGLITFYMFPVGALTFTRPFRYFHVFQTVMYSYFLYYLYKTKLYSFHKGTFHAIMYYSLISIFLGIFYLSLFSANENSHIWYQFFFENNV